MAVLTQQRPDSPDLSSGSSTDLIASASTALRRLHFRTASAHRSRGGKAQPLPKVVVMGSNSVSLESTNNTSTDSSNTAVTMVTVTDGESSLDISQDDAAVLRITPNLIEDLLNETPLSSIDKEESENFSSTSSTSEKDTNTLRASMGSRKLLFTPDRVSAISTEDDERVATPLIQSPPSKDDHQVPAKRSLIIENNTKDKEIIDPDNSLEWYRIKMRQANLENNMVRHSNHSVSRRLHTISKRYAKNNFGEDRLKNSRGSSGFAAEQMTVDSEDAFEMRTSPPVPTSPTGSPSSGDPPKESSTPSAATTTTEDQSPAPNSADSPKNIANSVSPTKVKKHFTFSPTVEHKSFPDKVNGNAGGRLIDGLSSAPASTGNDTVSSYNVSAVRKKFERKWSMTAAEVILEQPDNNNKNYSDTKTASIFIQQPSITGNSPDQTSQQMDTKECDSPKKREENMKLLDVANAYNHANFHEKELKYGCSHHSRSQSVKTPGRSGGGAGLRPNYLCLPQQRSRVASMPNTGVEEEYYRLRQFTVSGNKVVNRGDSLKSRRSRSNNSVASSNSSHSTEHITTGATTGCAVTGGGGGSYPGSTRTSATTSLASSRESSCASCPGITAPFRVLMLGGCGVGKSSLISQFMTSEYLHAFDASIDDEWNETSVSVLLDGEESELIFIDHPASDVTPGECIDTYEPPHAYCVIYSTADRSSFIVADECLQALWKKNSIKSKAVILVANKTDLVRSRVVTTEEGKTMAIKYDCKFIETSVGINHNVDELLVGILSQIRLKLDIPPDLDARDPPYRRRSRSPMGLGCGFRKYGSGRLSASLKVKGLLSRVWARDSKSKSCENLHVL